ncbi:S-methyl-5-thioribose-1-phosphate isomerase [Marinobacter sp. X15-166B]|uniref:S-methyl-5-thioribose-1-phosphate isomerase n=1 Tax=Marinobacter sp. X15-166B TaxID=1897620 RepID=UPI00085C9DF6|nr:S-methyl-5-thioribose-1-phosphate isomerase [Marinobacter sp. X15-166B]OEY65020.1 S-methyl-5-thioribose-1-phosphate isomerase [Marinobacter sp. X15-166B]
MSSKNPPAVSSRIGTVAMRWHGDRLELLDQRRLPIVEHWVSVDTASEVAASIRDMVVRGAPAIGISAAYGVVLAVQRASGPQWREAVRADMQVLAESRPTAVNLFWALQQMEAVLAECPTRQEAATRLAHTAIGLHDDDLAANLAMAEHALAVMDEREPFSVLTHCNTGALATGGYGTALGVIRRLHAAGRLQRVFVDETRPWMQGSRLTAWELSRDGIPVTLNADGAAAWILARGEVRWVVVGADRITANGDVANKIGTYSLAVLARYHRVRFMVVAPSSTIDMTLASGADIPIEQREGTEVRQMGEVVLAPEHVDVYNPVFDVTPAELIDVLVTERGVVHRPDAAAMQALFGARS